MLTYEFDIIKCTAVSKPALGVINPSVTWQFFTQLIVVGLMCYLGGLIFNKRCVSCHIYQVRFVRKCSQCNYEKGPYELSSDRLVSAVFLLLGLFLMFVLFVIK